jgi:hypothetical protein
MAYCTSSKGWMRKMEQMMEGDLAGETEVLKAFLSVHAVLNMLQHHHITTFFR